MTEKLFTLFLFHSYIVGWILTAIKAEEYPYKVDLCQFVRGFLISPFLTAVIWLFVVPICLNFTTFLIGMGVIIVAVMIMAILGYVIIGPAVRASAGVTKPFFTKIFIVLYKRKL